jgi:hypothetical protein
MGATNLRVEVCHVLLLAHFLAKQCDARGVNAIAHLIFVQVSGAHNDGVMDLLAKSRPDGCRAFVFGDGYFFPSQSPFFSPSLDHSPDSLPSAMVAVST